jgi:hypothetical protein
MLHWLLASLSSWGLHRLPGDYGRLLIYGFGHFYWEITNTVWYVVAVLLKTIPWKFLQRQLSSSKQMGKLLSSVFVSISVTRGWTSNVALL